MRMAVPVAGGLLCAHFGHCEEFALMDLDLEQGTVLGTKMLTPPAHEPGVLPRWLHEQGAHLIVAGGMGSRARQLFEQNGVQVVIGAPVQTPAELAAAYLNGSLTSGENLCDH